MGYYSFISLQGALCGLILDDTRRKSMVYIMNLNCSLDRCDRTCCSCSLYDVSKNYDIPFYLLMQTVQFIDFMILGEIYCDQFFYYGKLCYCNNAGTITPMNGTTCADKNECSVDNGGCEHTCINNNGMA